jgi:metal-responsive CopG/Arc/MetJ family transcriptional regulator
MIRQKVQTVSINIRMSEHLVSGLDMVADKKGLSRTELIRFLIQSAIEKEESK